MGDCGAVGAAGRAGDGRGLVSAHELESTGGADWRGYRPSVPHGLHWAPDPDDAETMILIEAAFNFHWGPVAPATSPDVDEDLVVIGRAGILALRAAAPNGQSAFDAAMAGTAAASSYTAMCAAAANEGITGPQAPANVARRWWLHCAADYPLT